MEPLVKVIGAKELYHQRDVAKISVVGAGMVHHSGVAAGMFCALASEEINIEIISTSEIRISCLIEKSRVYDAGRAIHKHFFA